MKPADVKKMKPAQVREKTTNELVKLGRELEDELFHLKFGLGSGQLKQTTAIGTVRRNLARVKTVLRQRELESSPSKE